MDLVGYAENFVKGEDLRAHSDDEEAARCLVSRIFQRKNKRKAKRGKEGRDLRISEVICKNSERKFVD